MSVAMTVAVADALDALPGGPALVYDLGAIASRMDRARAAAQATGIELLYAVKSFPIAAAIDLAVARLDGLDVAGPEEQALALALPRTNISVTWPGGVDLAAVAALAARHRVTVVCETAEQVAAASAIPHVTVAVRLASGDDSRFGIPAAALSHVATDRVRALHVHGGPLVTSAARLAHTAATACAAADRAGIPLEQLDLGGSLHGFTLDRPAAGQTTLAEAFAAARAAVPAHVRLLFEPGRLWTEGAGFAVGRVLATRGETERPVRVLSLSRLAHLRWCTPRLVAPPPRSGAPRTRVLLLGASCCEDDQIGDALVPTGHEPAVGARVVLAGITGYAAAWNRGFAGVPAAQVITLP